MTLKCLVLLSNIIKSHILKADRKRQLFIRLKSLAEHRNVIDSVFYNIFLVSVLLARLLLKICTNFRIELQNGLATFPVLFTAFEVFAKPKFMLLFSTEFLLQLVNAWLHRLNKCSIAPKSNRIWQLTFFALFLLIRVSVR